MHLPNKNSQGEAVACGLRSTPITPSDSAALDESQVRLGIYVGTGGDIVGRLAGDTADRTFKNVPSGTHLSYLFILLKTTGTTAANILGIA